MKKIQIPPHSEEMEKVLIGAVLLNPITLIQVNYIVPEDFYITKNNIIWNSILKLAEKTNLIDIITLSNQLEVEGRLSSVGGMEYIAELQSSCPSSSHIETYAKQVKEKSIRRNMIKAGYEIVNEAYEEENSIDESMEEAGKNIYGLCNSISKNQFEHVRDLSSKRFEHFFKIHTQGIGEAGLMTGFFHIDSILNGLKKSDLVILSARPSMGKTALALNIALNSSIAYGKKIGIFSLEMSKEQLLDRLISMVSGIDSSLLQKGIYTQEQFEKIEEAVNIIQSLDILIDDTVSSSLSDLRSKARRLQTEHGVDMLIIDYLQLMSVKEKNNQTNRTQEVSEISRSLKQLAKEMEVPVLCLSQLSRALETRPGKIPQLSDLRDSGSIEQDADVVMMMFREDYYEENTNRENITDIFIRKNRNGSTGRAELFWNAPIMRFCNMHKS